MSEYQYNKVTPEMIEKFKEIAPKRVLVGDEINEDFTHDEMAIYGKARPEVLVEATSTEEVAAVVKLCNENKVPVTPSGARTGLVGGAVSIGGGVMISLTKMNKILGYDKENFVVKIQSGVLLNDLAQDAEKQGLLYPPDPGEKFATVGGNVATNAGGMRAVKYGCTRDYVRAMTVVLPTGEIVKLGAKIYISDTGCGMPKDEISKITEAFYRIDKSRSRKQGGVGLGLAICKEIVRIHQGEMRFISQQGKGTTVIITIGGGAYEKTN